VKSSLVYILAVKCNAEGRVRGLRKRDESTLGLHVVSTGKDSPDKDASTSTSTGNTPFAAELHDNVSEVAIAVSESHGF
jgi:hypothetical protein